jgi:hypothetical protein
MRLVLLCLLALLMMGCGQPSETKPVGTSSKSSSQREKSDQERVTRSDIIDDVILQRSKLEAGKKAQDRIRKIQADREQQFKEALGE